MIVDFKFNEKTGIWNRVKGSIIIAVAMMVFPLIPIGVMTILGETLIYLFPGSFGFDSDLYSSIFVEMWMGGVLTLMGIMVIFGRKGSSIGINTSSITHEVRSQEDP